MTAVAEAVDAAATAAPEGTIAGVSGGVAWSCVGATGVTRVSVGNRFFRIFFAIVGAVGGFVSTLESFSTF